MSLKDTEIFKDRFASQDNDFLEKLKNKLSGQYFLKYIGFEFTLLQAGYTQGELNIEQHHLQNIGFFHGGITATVADVLMGFAASSLVAKDTHVVTADLRISYLNPGIGQKLTGAGWVIKAGSRLFFCEAELYCQNGQNSTLIAKASATMSTVVSR